MIRSLQNLRRSESGATAIEFALVALTAIATFLAVIEFGRALYISNSMSYAVDIAARKIMMNPAATNVDVEDTLRDAIGFGSSEDLEVTFGTETVDTVSFRTLLISYPLTLLVPNLTKQSIVLTTNRRVPLP